MSEQIQPIPGSPIWLTNAILRLNAGRPLFRGKCVDPFSAPDLPRHKKLHEWLRQDAPEDVKAYCRESLRFYRERKNIAPEWYFRLEAGLR